MSMEDIQLIRYLAERIGIKTAVELEAFKKHTGVKSKDALIKRLCLYVGTNTMFEAVSENKQIHD